MTDPTPEPWLEFAFDGPTQTTVTAGDVGHLLVNITAAARQIAVDLLNARQPKGPMNAAERALAAITLKSIGPGSILRIELAPPATEISHPLPLQESYTQFHTADDVIRALEADLCGPQNGGRPQRPKRRESILALKRSLERIGPDVSIAGTYSGEFKRVPIYRDEAGTKNAAATTVRRVYFGRATMADSGPERRRLRASLYDGRNLLLDVADEFAAPLTNIFDRDVEFRVVDTVDAGVVVRSIVDAVRPLEPAEVGNDSPARNWRRLAEEQGVDLAAPPDYVQLLQDLFDSEDEVDAFKRHIVASRSGYEPDD